MLGEANNCGPLLSTGMAESSVSFVAHEHMGSGGALCLSESIYKATVFCPLDCRMAFLRALAHIDYFISSSKQSEQLGMDQTFMHWDMRSLPFLGFITV